MTTQRCPACQRMNRVPPGAKARCGVCHAPLTPLPADSTSAGGSSDLAARVIKGWEELVRFVPSGLGLARATGQGGSGPSADPVTWLSAATQVPKDDLDQVRLLRIRLASNKTVPQDVLTSALRTLDRATVLLGRDHLPN